MNDIKITDVRVHPGDSAFLVYDDKTSIMYDSGFAFTANAVAEKIKGILGERQLGYIFLTHSHYDHALGSVYVKKHYPKAKIVAGEYAAKIFAKPSARAVMRELDGKVAAQCGVLEYEDLIDGLCVDIPVSDGDVIKARDMEFTALNLPGHTKCSVGYYCRKHRLLLGSETIGVFDGRDEVVPSYLVGYGMTLESIKRVESLEIENILVPHYGLLDKEQTRRYLERARKSAEETAKEIVDFLRSGSSVSEIMEYFRNKFWHGYVREIYPVDAMELNTSIMIELLRREFGL